MVLILLGHLGVWDCNWATAAQPWSPVRTLLWSLARWFWLEGKLQKRGLWEERRKQTEEWVSSLCLRSSWCRTEGPRCVCLKHVPTSGPDEWRWKCLPEAHSKCNMYENQEANRTFHLSAKNEWKNERDRDSRKVYNCPGWSAQKWQKMSRRIRHSGKPWGRCRSNGLKGED